MVLMVYILGNNDALNTLQQYRYKKLQKSKENEKNATIIEYLFCISRLLSEN